MESFSPAEARISAHRRLSTAALDGEPTTGQQLLGRCDLTGRSQRIHRLETGCFCQSLIGAHEVPGPALVCRFVQCVGRSQQSNRRVGCGKHRLENLLPGHCGIVVVARSPRAVVITGATGIGKTRLARSPA